MLFRSIFFLAAACGSLRASTVVVTSLPDEAHPAAPLTSLAGVPLTGGSTVRIGAFPGMSDAAVLDLAAQGGLAAVTAAFAAFGEACQIGDGAGGAAGRFEIAVRQPLTGSPWVGETVSLLIEAGDGQFLIARFTDRRFEADTDTGLESLLSLHLADATVVVGNRYGSGRVAASTAPESGSFDTWIGGFPEITDPLLRLPDADADGDGRSNFVEYATGGNPASATDPAPCEMVADATGVLWVRFARATGIGAIRHVVETSGDLAEPWQELGGTPEPDPAGGPHWMRLPVPPSVTGKGFFRLNPRPD